MTLHPRRQGLGATIPRSLPPQKCPLICLSICQQGAVALEVLQP